ncbi:MAG: thioredoxin family protein [Bacilli bacterium]|nr:thioredoxin family protein [Bacilli bacterium]
MSKEIQSVEEFDTLLAEGGKIVVDFFATWCGPCKMMGRVIEDVENDYPDVNFVKVDVDQLPAIAQRYGVYSIPQINLFLNGTEANKLIGSRPASAFKAELDKAFN